MICLSLTLPYLKASFLCIILSLSFYRPISLSISLSLLALQFILLLSLCLSVSICLSLPVCPSLPLFIFLFFCNNRTFYAFNWWLSTIPYLYNMQQATLSSDDDHLNFYWIEYGYPLFPNRVEEDHRWYLYNNKSK